MQAVAAVKIWQRALAYLAVKSQSEFINSEGPSACEMAHASRKTQAVKPRSQMPDLRMDEPDVNCITLLSVY